MFISLKDFKDLLDTKVKVQVFVKHKIENLTFLKFIDLVDRKSKV